MKTRSNKRRKRVDDIDSFIDMLPKVELHLHIEGTLEAETVFDLAQKNNVKLAYKSVQELKNAYQFENLQQFLDLYYQACDVLITQQDFYQMTMAYLTRVHDDNLVHVELFVDPQSHTHRGIVYQVIMDGIWQALKEANEKWGMTSKIIPCVLRHLSPESGMEMLEQTLEYMKQNQEAPIVAIGLDSSEKDRPPHLFQKIFDKAREHGLKVVSHAGEEGPPSYMTEALDLLHVNRIDHGVRCLEDLELVKRLAKLRMPLTVCPNSNIKLCVFDKYEDHNLKILLEEHDLCVTINSDDPAYFGGYITQNYQNVTHALKLSKEQLTKLARNGIEASFLTDEEKESLYQRLEDAVKEYEGRK